MPCQIEKSSAEVFAEVFNNARQPYRLDSDLGRTQRVVQTIFRTLVDVKSCVTSTSGPILED